VPEVEGEFQERMLEFDSRVVDEDVETSESRNGLIDQVLHLRGIGDVGLDRDSASACRSYFH
jgi:hypothetical protein